MRNFLRAVLRAFINLIVRVEVHGYEHLPPTGSFIIASNHLGMLDAALLYYAVDRWDVFVPVAEKWEQNPFLRWMGKYFNFIFIDRYNPDLKALRKIIGLMEAGRILVIAPEGTRSPVGSLIEGRPGVSYLAAKLNRPIIPVGLTGTEDKVVFAGLKRLRRSQVVIRAGVPFTLPPLKSAKDRDAALKEYTDEIMCRIARLLPEKYRGVYAEHPRLKQLLAT